VAIPPVTTPGRAEHQRRGLVVAAFDVAVVTTVGTPDEVAVISVEDVACADALKLQAVTILFGESERSSTLQTAFPDQKITPLSSVAFTKSAV
jgi:hypothetical protein